ncbi:glycosyltransferase family 22 protein [Roridomyces roridus]|uniref:Mannosyltransferase n=1 Tax=Roridomyces roridus TaxID=1738132 RepID=A0AAD7BX47_9AGAR|nr:glycosyltransferase family 22 protein [Roridomyces roridus]
MVKRCIVYYAVLTRVFIALFTATVFQPDEYFQSLEPAHHLVFGYGHLTWEWLSPRPIRSILYPALNVPVYWILKTTGLDASDWLLIGCPRVLHGTLASLTDIFLCSLTETVLGERYVSTALLISLTSPFHVLALSRSLSNSLETSLTTVALAFYPWIAGPNVAIDRYIAIAVGRSHSLMFLSSRVRLTLGFAALSCAIRPTNAILWAYLVGHLLLKMRSSLPTLTAIIQDGAVIALAALSGIFLLDTVYYGIPTFTPLNFLVTNLSSVSLFYGGNAWHYYLSQAIPILCATTLPFVLLQVRHILCGRASPALASMLGCIIWTISVYSLAGHKEWRFIHPLLPMLHLFAAKCMYDMSVGPKRSLALRPSLLAALLVTIPISLYIALLYCSGPIEVMAFIRDIPRSQLRDGVGLLMPCHSTPGHAYLHRPELANGTLWALGCEPPLQSQDPATYRDRDQTTVFFGAPYTYLDQRFPQTVDPTFPPSPFPASIPGTVQDTAAELYAWVHAWPRHLAFFGALLEQEGVRDLLQQRGYAEIWSAGRVWEGDCDERKGGVRVWKYVV